MAISLVTNVDTATVLSNLDRTQRSVSKNVSKLSSGLRINTAADDAAGLAISEQLKAQTRGVSQAMRNAQDGISMLQVAEGAFNEYQAVLQRMRELTVQSANGTQTDTTRGFIDQEYQALFNEIDQIATSTNFNGIKLMTQANFEVDFQVGANADPAENRISVALYAFDGPNTVLVGTTVSTAGAALFAMDMLDVILYDTTEKRGMIGAAQNSLTLAIDNLASLRENLLAANSRIRDVDVATETSDMARNQILAQAGVSVLAQANQLPSLGLSLLR